MIDRDIHLAKALLVEGNPLLRTVTATQLRDSGVGQVTTAAGIKQARLLLERERFDIVLCSREFEGKGDSGQDLLDELRREHQLPHSTVFIMTSGRAVYHEVVEAAESALDGMLVRPYTTAQLSKRLYDARHRKRELGPILKALDEGETEAAMARALRRFQLGQPMGMFCGRLAAELLLTLGRPEDARKVFETLLSTGAQDWARLGVARVQMAMGNLRAARISVQGVLDINPTSADAHDLIGRLLVEQCDFDAALRHYQQAADLTPGCLLRAQHAGALAFYQGQPAQGLKHLERALSLGVESKLFDALTLPLVALLRCDAGNAPGVAAMLRQVQQFRQRFPESERLQRFEQAAQALVDMLARDWPTAQARLESLSDQSQADDFDLEAANLLLALWARLPQVAPMRTRHAAVVEQLALRFCVSRSIAEVLIAAAQRDPEVAGVVRRCQGQVSAIAEQAMSMALQGDALGAVRSLLLAGEQHGNAKLLEMAALMARRHADQLPPDQATALADQAQRRLRQSCRATYHIAGLQRSGRSPGGLQLRGRSRAAEMTDATA